MRRPRRRLRARPRFYLLLILCMLIGFGASCTAAHVRCLHARRRADALEAERRSRAERVERLTRQLAYVQSDAYVEQVARDELNLILPGEIRYIAG